MEIYTDVDGEVIFKKYSPIGELSEFAAQYAEVLVKGTDIPVMICDRDHCIAAAGVSKKEVLERRITQPLEEIMEQRRAMTFSNENSPEALEGVKKGMLVGIPIINAGDVCGAVVLLSDDSGAKAEEADVKLVSVAAEFLGKQLDDIFQDIPPHAVKIGMVASGDLIEVIAEKLKKYQAV